MSLGSECTDCTDAARRCDQKPRTKSASKLIGKYIEKLVKEVTRKKTAFVRGKAKEMK